MITPTFSKVKPLSCVRYRDKKGITMVPALLIRVTNANHHTSLDKPLKELI
jgi:hypothetical protein